jgi:hypothetical protein
VAVSLARRSHHHIKSVFDLAGFRFRIRPASKHSNIDRLSVGIAANTSTNRSDDGQAAGLQQELRRCFGTEARPDTTLGGRIDFAG